MCDSLRAKIDKGDAIVDELYKIKMMNIKTQWGFMLFGPGNMRPEEMAVWNALGEFPENKDKNKGSK